MVQERSFFILVWGSVFINMYGGIKNQSVPGGRGGGNASQSSHLQSGRSFWEEETSVEKTSFHPQLHQGRTKTRGMKVMERGRRDISVVSSAAWWSRTHKSLELKDIMKRKRRHLCCSLFIPPQACLEEEEEEAMKTSRRSDVYHFKKGELETEASSGRFFHHIFLWTTLSAPLWTGQMWSWLNQGYLLRGRWHP